MDNATYNYHDRHGLDLIADLLGEPGKPWSSDTLDQVAEIVSASGRYIPDNADSGELYLRRTSCLCRRDLPEDCIADCSASGDVTASVEYWQAALPFNVEPEAARRYLAECGAWDREDLAGEDPVTLAQRVLWLACCEFREHGENPDECADVFSLGG